jgi:hypothetical protein
MTTLAPSRRRIRRFAPAQDAVPEHMNAGGQMGARSRSALRVCCLASAVLVALAAGCRDSSSPTVPKAKSPVKHVDAALIADPNSWNTFSADITTLVRRYDAQGTAQSSLPPMVYHIDRRLDATTGFWKTITTFQSRRAGITSNTAHFAPELIEIGRTEDDGNGTPLRVFNRAGELFTPPKVKPVSPTSSISLQPPVGLALARTLAAHHTTASRPAVPEPFERKWVDAFVLRPDGAAARLAAVQRRYGEPTRTNRGTNVYTLAQDSISSALEVDPATGGPLSIVVSARGVVVSRTTITYAHSADGAAIRSHVHTESIQAGESGGRHTIDTDITNIQFGKEG